MHMLTQCSMSLFLVESVFVSYISKLLYVHSATYSSQSEVFVGRELDDDDEMMVSH